MKIRTGMLVSAMVVAVLLCASFSWAGAKVVNIDGVIFSVDASMKDNLETLTGKRVSLTLDSGKIISGTIKTVGAHLVHVEKLERREFFDALVRTDRISAVDTLFREYER